PATRGRGTAEIRGSREKPGGKEASSARLTGPPGRDPSSDLFHTRPPRVPHSQINKTPIKIMKTGSKRPRLSLTLPLIAAALLTQGGRADDWPQWRGPERNGISR